MTSVLLAVALIAAGILTVIAAPVRAMSMRHKRGRYRT